MDSTAAGRFQRAALGPRTLTAAVGIPLLLSALAAGGWWWAGLVVVVGLIAWFEFARLHALDVRLRAASLPLSISVFGVLLIASDRAVMILLVLWAAAIIYGGLIWYFWREWILTILPPWRTLGMSYRVAVNATGFSAWYLPVPFALLARWRFEFSLWSVLAFLLAIWANDTAAYFVGLYRGRHKLAPHISPGKSWEGAIAGAAAGALVGLVASPWLAMVPVAGVAFGALITTASQVGDLLESAMKRKAGVKDSGTILPGHGGILDRFDGILLAAPVAYVLVRMWGAR